MEPPSLTPRLKVSLVSAGETAERLGQSYVGVEHVFLALVEDADGCVSSVLHDLGVLDEARERIRAFVEDPPSGSNVVVDENGEPYGFMVEAGDGTFMIVDAQGRPLRTGLRSRRGPGPPRWIRKWVADA